MSAIPAGSAEQRRLDESYMRRAFGLARRGRPDPNPHVGALVVLDGRVVGEGYHERAGGPHAEAAALAQAGALARGATLYVTLEPCNHHGRTPPCVDAILRAGVRRVVVGCPDPNPLVRGGGSSALRRLGVEVAESPCLAEALALIAAWRASLPFRTPQPAAPSPREPSARLCRCASGRLSGRGSARQ